MRRHADSHYYGASCNVAFDIIESIESQFIYRLLATGSCSHLVLLLCCARNLVDDICSTEVCVWRAAVVETPHSFSFSFFNPKLHSLNGAFLERRAPPKDPDEDPLGSFDLVTVPVWIHWCFYAATPFFCSCFPNLLNSALPNTGPPADPSDYTAHTWAGKTLQTGSRP